MWWGLESNLYEIFVKYYFDYRGKPKDDESTMLEPSAQINFYFQHFVKIENSCIFGRLAGSLKRNKHRSSGKVPFGSGKEVQRYTVLYFEAYLYF